ncbi:MAG: sensor histidine kinase, partial [Dehalococcoidia bacterium]|nr:sensor histidine kinase [Dehalococcoidia bacterium]
EIDSVIDEVTRQVRNLSLDLRPGILDDLGLVPALQWYLDRQLARTGLAVKLSYRGLDRVIPGDVATAAYRIIQEALTNTMRHAGVRKAEIRLWSLRRELCFRVSDRGAGFDPARASVGSTGLSAMRERALLLGGRCIVTSTPGSGTRVEVRLPIPAESAGKRTAPDGKVGIRHVQSSPEAALRAG